MKVISRAQRLLGTVNVPGDKSISHRYAILGAMAEGTTRIDAFSSSADCQSTLDCLAGLGVSVRRRGSYVEIDGRGWRSLRRPTRALDAGNSGTTMRLLSGVVAGRPFQTTIQGDASLNQRPMRRIITPLTRMGAEIRARDDQFPPLTIVGAALTPIRYELPVASAQVKSCVLLAGLSARGRTSVVEVHASRDHTERALPVFGVAVEREGSCLSVAGPCSLRSADVRVPGDFSAGVFFMLAALMVQGSEIRIPRLGLNPSRTGLLTLLKHSGAAIETSDFHQGQGEPTADLTVRFSEEALERFPRSIGGEWIPNLIDEIPALAVFGVALRHGLTVVDADELRKKESDRIHAVVSNLRALGVAAEESSDGFRIPPGARFRGGKVRTFGDHRIAMAFALAGLIADEPVELDDWECSAVSFPGFFDELAAAAR